MLRKLAHAIVLLYLVIACGLAAGVYVWFYGAWAAERDAISERLAGDAVVVTNFIQANLIDTSKLLDLARLRIVEGSERRPLDAEATHRILDSTLKSFSFSVSEDLRGLLFYIDPDARMVAQSGQYPAPSFDFSDRLYYRKLIADPSAKVAVGNLLTAKTTGQLVFHISMPVRNAKGKLLGILVQQIRAHDLAALVMEFVEDKSAVIVTRLSSAEPVFVYPVGSTPPVFAQSPCRKSGDKGALVAKALGADTEPLLVGYASSSSFGLCSSASLPEKAAFTRFLREHLAELITAVIALLLTTGLFIAVLRLVRRLDDEIDLSNHDALTGLHNRRFIDAVYESYARASIRNASPLAVLFLDIDHFKEVNDAYGHPVGDLVLKTVGGVLRQEVKRPLDVCCRWGGEEFVALLPDADVAGALAVAREIQGHLSRLVIRSGDLTLPSVTVSIGVVARVLTPETVRDDLVALADKAMLEAKADGRDRIVVYKETSGESGRVALAIGV